MKLGVSVASQMPPSYQWRFNGADLAGATNTTLKLSKIQLAHEGAYSVTVSNHFGGTESDLATLTVLAKPTITLPPLSQSVVRGSSVTFSAAFTGNPMPFGVQWRHGSQTLASNTVTGGQDFFTITNALTTDAGTWSVAIRNLASASGVKRSFRLTVLADSDGVLWIGTPGSGLVRFQNGKWTRYAARDGLGGISISYLII